MAYHGYAVFFDSGVVWVQHGPVIVWLIRDWVFGGGLEDAGPPGFTAAGKAGTGREQSCHVEGVG
jgi:hypothetical protein